MVLLQAGGRVSKRPALIQIHLASSSFTADPSVCNPADDVLRATWRGQQHADFLAVRLAGGASHSPRRQPRHLDAGAHVCQAAPHDAALKINVLPGGAVRPPAATEAIAADHCRT